MRLYSINFIDLYYIKMFNNVDPKTNGEEKFFMDIKDNINILRHLKCIK